MYPDALYSVQYGTAPVFLCSFFEFQYLKVVNMMLHRSLSQYSKSFPCLTDGEILLTKDKMAFVFMTEKYRFSLLYSYALLSSALLCPLLSTRTSYEF